MGSQEPIHVLIVDDAEPPVRELKKAFEAESKGQQEFVFEVETAPSVSDYQQRVKAENKPSINVLVVDLILDPGAELLQGVSEIISWHHLHSPDTIIIVFSAFTAKAADPMDAAISACVQAMRVGASDCIKKGIGSTRKVVQAALRELRHRRDPSLEFDHVWWERNCEVLTTEFGGQAVAVLGDIVVASADTVPDLRQRLKEPSVLEQLKQHRVDATSLRLILVPEGN